MKSVKSPAFENFISVENEKENGTNVPQMAVTKLYFLLVEN